MEDKREWIMYESSTGLVVSGGSGTNAEIASVSIPNNCRIFLDYKMTERTYFDILDGVPKEREYVPYTWNNATKVLSDLPVPCTLDIHGVKWTVSDGIAEFSADISGRYVIVIAGDHTRLETIVEIELD